MRLRRRLGDEYVNYGFWLQPHPLAPSPERRGGNIWKNISYFAPLLLLREGVGG